MEKKKKKIIIGTFVTLILIGAACAGTVYYYLFAPQFHPQKTVYIYIDRDDTADSIYNTGTAERRGEQSGVSSGERKIIRGKYRWIRKKFGKVTGFR